MAPTPHWIQELASRKRGRYDVTILCNTMERRLILRVYDALSGEWFLRGADSGAAREALRDPSAYVRLRRSSRHDAAGA